MLINIDKGGGFLEDVTTKKKWFSGVFVTTCIYLSKLH